MVNPIMNPDEAEQALVMEFNEFVKTHWFFNGRERGPKIVKKSDYLPMHHQLVNENDD